MRTLLVIAFSASLQAGIIEPGQTLKFTASHVLDNERIRLLIYGPEQAELAVSYDRSEISVGFGSGWRTTEIDGVKIREYVHFMQATTAYLYGAIGDILVTNIADAPFVFDQVAMSFRHASTGVSWGLEPTYAVLVPQRDDSSEMTHNPEPSTWAMLASASGTIYLLSRRRKPREHSR